MNILFVTDSTIPNVALMKYATWCARHGHTGGFDIDCPDHIIISCVFTANLPDLCGVARYYPDATFIVGGPGAYPPIALPNEIEILPPDYSIYPRYKDSIGYVTAGCMRKCPFCAVHRMGHFRYVQHVSRFYHGGAVRLLDDNILCMFTAFRETCEWLTDNDVAGDFEYLDIRLLTSDTAELLYGVKRTRKCIRFAYDITSRLTETIIEKNVKILRDMFSNSAIQFLVYIASDSIEDRRDAMHRWSFLRALDIEVHGMPDIGAVHDKDLIRRVKRPAIWRNLSPEEVFGV